MDNDDINDADDDYNGKSDEATRMTTTLFYTICYRRNVGLICMLLTNSDMLNLMNSPRCVLTD